jgi:hypothetical protein
MTLSARKSEERARGKNYMRQQLMHSCRTRVEVRAIRFSNIGEQVSRRRRIHHAFAGESSGEPSHLHSEFCNFDQSDQSVDHWSLVGRKYASTREDGHDNSAGRDDDLCAFCSTLPGRDHKLFDNFCAYRFVFKCLVQHLAALYLHLIDRDQPTR